MDTTEAIRREQLAEINSKPAERVALEEKHGQVWTTDEVQRDFSITGFLAPYVGVTRKSDGKKGSMQFQHSPRYYFNFVAE